MTVFVLGGYQTDFSRNWTREGKHVDDMLVEAVNGALEATGIAAEDVEVGHVGNFAAELYAMQGHLGAFLLEAQPAFAGLPTSRHEAACASGSIALLAASADIEAGRYELALVAGVEQMKTVDSARGGDFLGTAAWYDREAKGVAYPFPAIFGRLGDEYERRYGIDNQHLGRISSIAYENARRNPLAQTRAWYQSDEQARGDAKYNTPIVGRLKASDCSQITDGAVCVLLASPAYATKHAKARGLELARIPQLLGWGHRTARMAFEDKLAESAGNPYILPHTRAAIVDALRRANVPDVWGVDAIETHDCFTTSEYMAIDHFGITPPGQSWQAIEEGIIDFDGQLPINPSGGLIGTGHPVGATGVRQVLDAYRQVTGTAGGYQVEGAKKVATLNIGGSGTTSVSFVIGAAS